MTRSKARVGRARQPERQSETGLEPKYTVEPKMLIQEHPCQNPARLDREGLALSRLVEVIYKH